MLPVKLGAGHEATTQFRSEAGQSLVASQKDSGRLIRLAGSQGLAISITPMHAPLPPMGSATISLTAFAAMSGSYADLLHVQVWEVSNLE